MALREHSVKIRNKTRKQHIEQQMAHLRLQLLADYHHSNLIAPESEAAVIDHLIRVQNNLEQLQAYQIYSFLVQSPGSPSAHFTSTLVSHIVRQDRQSAANLYAMALAIHKSQQVPAELLAPGLVRLLLKRDSGTPLEESQSEELRTAAALVLLCLLRKGLTLRENHQELDSLGPLNPNYLLLLQELLEAQQLLPSSHCVLTWIAHPPWQLDRQFATVCRLLTAYVRQQHQGPLVFRVVEWLVEGTGQAELREGAMQALSEVLEGCEDSELAEAVSEKVSFEALRGPQLRVVRILLCLLPSPQRKRLISDWDLVQKSIFELNREPSPEEQLLLLSLLSVAHQEESCQYGSHQVSLLRNLMQSDAVAVSLLAELLLASWVEEHLDPNTI